MQNLEEEGEKLFSECKIIIEDLSKVESAQSLFSQTENIVKLLSKVEVLKFITELPPQNSTKDFALEEVLEVTQPIGFQSEEKQPTVEEEILEPTNDWVEEKAVIESYEESEEAETEVLKAQEEQDYAQEEMILEMKETSSNYFDPPIEFEGETEPTNVEEEAPTEEKVFEKPEETIFEETVETFVEQDTPAAEFLETETEVKSDEQTEETVQFSPEDTVFIAPEPETKVEEKSYQDRIREKELELEALEERRRKIIEFDKKTTASNDENQIQEAIQKVDDQISDKKFKLANIKGLKSIQTLFDDDPLAEIEEKQEKVTPKEIPESSSLLKTNMPTDFMEAEKPKPEFRLDLNDRIAFTKTLFGGSQVELNDTIAFLNSCKTAEQAKEYLSDLYYEKNWKRADEYAQRLWVLVENRFF